MESCTFRGKRYRIRRRKHPREWGRCDPPEKSGKTIWLDPNPKPMVAIPKGSERLYLAIHEGLHACLWDLDEEAVHDTAESLTRFIWGLGFREQIDLEVA